MPLKKIFLLVFLLMLISCSKSQTFIRNQIYQENYCTTKDDCVNIGSKCPFGCYILVNKNEAEKIKKLVNSYESNCVYDCMYCPDFECKNGRCEPVCK